MEKNVGNFFFPVTMNPPTVLETVLLSFQPKSLQTLAAKNMAKVVMENDLISKTMDKCSKLTQNLIAPHLSGKWFFQFFKSRGNSLLSIEKGIIDKQHEKETIYFVKILYRFLQEMQNSVNGGCYKTALDCYISQCCKSVDLHPTALYQIGIRQELNIWFGKDDHYMREYLASDQPNYSPGFDPLQVSANLTTFSHTVYTCKNVLIPGNVDTTHELGRFEVPHRLCWAKTFAKTEKNPEALCQLLSCLNTLDPCLHSKTEHLEVFTLLILIFAKLQINIRATNALFIKSFTLIKHKFQEVQFAAPLIKFFSELGNFDWAKLAYLRFLDQNKQSIFRNSTFVAYAESLIELGENICFYITTIREFHQNCKSADCTREKAQGIVLQNFINILKELNCVIQQMSETPEKIYIILQYKMLTVFYFKLSNQNPKIQPLLLEIKGQIDLFRKSDNLSYILSVQVDLLHEFNKERGVIFFQDIVGSRIAQVTASNLSSLKIKMLVKCMVWMLVYYKTFTFSCTTRDCFVNYLQELTKNLSALSNKKCYRLRLLYLMEQVFMYRKSHTTTPSTELKFKPSLLTISANKNRFLRGNVAPTFARLDTKDLNNLMENEEWVSRQSLAPYTHDANLVKTLIKLDPFIREHISFGASQLKFHDRRFRVPVKYPIEFPPVLL